MSTVKPEVKIALTVAQSIKPAPKNAPSLATIKNDAQQQPSDLKQLDFEQLQALPVTAAWDRWTLLMRLQERQLALETMVLVQKLRRGSYAVTTIYKKAAALMKDNSLTPAQRLDLINLLGEASTPEALQILAKILQESADDTLRHAIADAISHGTSGLSEWELKSHPELSPILETLWQQLEPDQQIAKALATRIVREGAPSGIKLILEELGQNGETVEEIVQNNNPRRLAALQAMKEARNPELLPILKQTFQSQPIDSGAFSASGAALSSMGNVEATRILLDWARNAPDSAADIAQQWVGAAAGNDPDSSEFLKKILIQNSDFHSDLVKQNILAAIKERE